MASQIPGLLLRNLNYHNMLLQGPWNQVEVQRPGPANWVAVKELNLSYHIMDIQ